MAEQPKIVTGLGKAELDRILIRGHDLTKNLLGQITFSQMAFLLLLGRLPNPEQTRMTDALLTVLVEHGMVSGVIAARLTHYTAPEAIQGAVAVALLGAGSVHLGSSEWSAKMLLDAWPRESKETDFGATAASVVERYTKDRKRIPGIGHRTHAEGDPRANRLFQIAKETGVYGRYCDLLKSISAAAEARHQRRVPVNVTGAIASIALDMGLPWQMAKAFALIGRTLGAVAHIGEEIKNPMGRNIQAAIQASLSYDPEG
ncbi:MAG: citryl-CoA lyase [Candidatus Binatia bacterium]|jgi:citrate synthase|nr:citryl-CoA lyase [Candidatus Binatia bacterium]|tara:strand:- start:465 stop:1241 length:777 start_codon:yes stop_codon:yes gene_type:complete